LDIGVVRHSIRGFRILAMSIVPVNEDATQVYGTRNAGNTVLNDDPKFNEHAIELAKALNLKSHMIKGKWIHTGVDCEGHKGADNRFYMVSTRH
jgi:hypothetical protein